MSGTKQERTRFSRFAARLMSTHVADYIIVIESVSIITSTWS